MSQLLSRVWVLTNLHRQQTVRSLLRQRWWHSHAAERAITVPAARLALPHVPCKCTQRLRQKRYKLGAKMIANPLLARMDQAQLSRPRNLRTMMLCVPHLSVAMRHQ